MLSVVVHFMKLLWLLITRLIFKFQLMWNFCRRIMSSSKLSPGTRTNASQDPPACSILEYEGLKKAMAEKKSLLIDVRERNEIIETGMIPGFINIPGGEIESALQLPPEEFQKQYNASKPNYDTPMIFSCRSGKRSYAACDKVVKLGFRNSASYSGGWCEWEEKTLGEQGQR